MKHLLIVLSILMLSASLFAQAIDTLWYEDWESDWTNDWHVSAGTWEVGFPTSGPSMPFDSLNCAATVLAGNYSEPVSSLLIRHISFLVPPASENPRLRFWHWYSFSSGDFGEVQISYDGMNWQTISPTYTNTGSGVWSYSFIDLSAYANSSVQIAFYFHSEQVGPYGNVSTGWYIDNVAVITGPLVFNNPENFESGIGDWAAEKGTWEVGTPTSGPSGGFMSQNCAATRLNGNYAEPVDSRLISSPVVIPNIMQNPRLRFWHWYSFSSGDFGEVQISTDGISWQTISTTYVNTGSGVWTYPFIDLSAYADSTVQIAFYFHSQQVGPYGNVSTGWYIDNVSVITGQIVFNNPENFESGIGDWAAEKGTWEVGVPTSGPDSSFSPPNCAATVLGGNYSEPVDSRLISAPFVLSNQSPALRFWHWYSFSSGDYGLVQIRVQDGLWQPISPDTFVATSSGAWTNYFIPLSAYADSTVQIAFYFHSQQVGPYGNVSSGWYIDSIEVDIVDGLYEIKDRDIPFFFRLLQNYPNPFNPTTTISYRLRVSDKIKLIIYNVLGQPVRTLVDEQQSAGPYQVQWDGRNDEGVAVASGVYLYRLSTENKFVESRKMLLIR